MDPKIKKRWIVALTSGKFKRAFGELKTPKGYCCLGVLCELHRRSTKGEWDLDKEGSYTYLRTGGVLPHKVRKWAGLKSIDPELGDDTAIACNDGLNYSFRKIAALIEKHL